MEKVTINPIDEKQHLLLESIKIKNEFIKLGYTKRKAFVNAVQENIEEYRSYKYTQYLIDFWLNRVKDKSLNKHLLLLINQLKKNERI